MITLDCHSSASLNFSESRKKAVALVGRGEKIEWHFDFGLFDKLLFPLFDPMQTGAHRHAIEHFMKSLWPALASYSTSLSLYKGPLHTPVEFPQFANYINLLADFFSEELPFSLHFQQEPPSLFDQAIKLTPENFSRFSLSVNGAPPSFRNHDNPSALLIPLQERQTPEIIGKLQKAIESSFFTRFVYEAYLTSEWEGVAKLYLLEEYSHPVLERKLAGFTAAEGIIQRI